MRTRDEATENRDAELERTLDRDTEREPFRPAPTRASNLANVAKLHDIISEAAGREAARMHAIVQAIEQSTATVLAQKGIPDPEGRLAREIARNSAQTVIFAIDELEAA